MSLPTSLEKSSGINKSVMLLLPILLPTSFEKTSEIKKSVMLLLIFFILGIFAYKMQRECEESKAEIPIFPPRIDCSFAK